MSERDFLKHRNVGRKSLEVVKSSLLKLNPRLSFGQEHLRMGLLEKAALESMPVTCAQINLKSFTGDPLLKLDTLGDVCSATHDELKRAFHAVPKWTDAVELTEFEKEINRLRYEIKFFNLKPNF